ncbi:MAG: ROK family transcriptional regulator [Chloroflexi bacterium]|nr:ROK family transcriptional regulator [Chloroflexota bacterium]
MKSLANTPLIRRLNEVAVLDFIRDHGPVSRTGVARALQLSPPTITRIVNQLMAEGLIFEAETGDSTGGRPPILLEFNRYNSLIIGICLGSTQVRGVLADLEGEILERRTVAVSSGDAAVAALLDLIEQFLTIPRPAGQAVRGIGLAMPAALPANPRTILSAPAPNWSDLSINDLVTDRFHIPAFSANDINLAALGEYWRGAGQGIKNQVIIAVGDCIRAGLILNGELFTGWCKAAGEIGYILTERIQLSRTYTEFGALESEAAIPAIVRRLQGFVASGRSSKVMDLAGGELDHVSLQHIFDAALQDDPVANEVLHATADYLAIAIANLACILNPELVILGGELSPYVSLLIPLVEARIEGTVPAPPRLAPSALGTEAPIFGAIALVLRSTSRLADVHLPSTKVE